MKLRLGRLTLTWTSARERAEEISEAAWNARQPDEARQFMRWLQSPLPQAPAGLDDECELCAAERRRTGSATALCWLCEVLKAKSPAALPGEESRDEAPERKEP